MKNALLVIIAIILIFFSYHTYYQTPGINIGPIRIPFQYVPLLNKLPWFKPTPSPPFWPKPKVPKEVDCDNCKGTGKVVFKGPLGNERSIICTKCFGKGKVTVTDDTETSN